MRRWQTERNPEAAAAAVFAVLGLGAIDVLVLLPILVGVVSVLCAFFIVALVFFVVGAVVLDRPVRWPPAPRRSPPRCWAGSA